MRPVLSCWLSDPATPPTAPSLSSLRHDALGGCKDFGRNDCWKGALVANPHLRRIGYPHLLELVGRSIEDDVSDVKLIGENKRYVLRAPGIPDGIWNQSIVQL